ncbi:cache domain-containing protein, partial [Amylibacter marinus]|uniref:cache domain-containing protein n=1 Tax=Amylibacter marinus TaxID=1475483 RepID=UPI0024E108CB
MKLSLGALLAICLAGLQFIAVLTVVLLSYFTSQRVLIDHARAQMSDLGQNAILHSKGFLDPALGTAQLAKRLAENQIIASDNPEELEALLFQQLLLAPKFSGVYFGDEQGNFVFVSRTEATAPYRTKFIRQSDTLRHTEYIWRDADFNVVKRQSDPHDTFDPRGRPWYTHAKSSRDIIWTDPYIFFSSQRPGITTATPVIGTDGLLRGVIGVDIEIQALSEFLAQLKIGASGAAMILNRNGDVIAHPDPNLIKIKRPNGNLDFVSISDIPDDIAQTAFGTLTPSDIGALTQEVQSDFHHSGDNYVSTLIPAHGQSLPWTIAIYAREDDFIGGIKDNRTRNIWIAAVIAMISGAAGLKLAQYINRPVRNFAKRATQVVRGDLPADHALGKTYPELREANQTLIQEITRRKTFEREFGLTFDMAAQGMAQIDPETGQFTRINQQLCDILGYDNDQMLAMRLGDILHPDTPAQEIALRAALHQGNAYDHEHRFLHHAGGEIWLRLNAILLRDPQGNPLHIIASIDDITQHKEAEQKISALRQELSHFARVNMMGQMASGLAHELNQPLTAITQNADAALLTLEDQSDPNPELRQILTELDAQAHRGADIIRALRGFVRKDGGTKAAFDLGELVTQTFRLVHPEATEHRVALICDPPP